MLIEKVADKRQSNQCTLQLSPIGIISIEGYEHDNPPLQHRPVQRYHLHGDCLVVKVRVDLPVPQLKMAQDAVYVLCNRGPYGLLRLDQRALLIDIRAPQQVDQITRTNVGLAFYFGTDTRCVAIGSFEAGFTVLKYAIYDIYAYLGVGSAFPQLASKRS